MSKTIALFLPNWIGDAVMATPAIRAIRERYPDARLIAVGRRYVNGVLEGSPWFDAIIPIEKNLLGACRLRRENIDIAVLFPNSFRSAFQARLAGCRRRIGFRRHGRSFLLTDRLDPHRDALGRTRPAPILLDYNRLGDRVGAPVHSNRMELFTTIRDERAADEVWNRAGFGKKPVVCLNPGAAFGAAKLWPTPSFAALARRLIRDRDCDILILCGPAERELARAIARMSSEPRVHSLADDPVSLGLTKACICRCALLITTDSGPRHFGAAFDRPVVSLFGPTHIEWTQTFHPHEVQLQHRVPCGPCQLRNCPTDHRCMTGLTPDAVFAAASGLLDRWQAAPVGEGCHAA